MKILYFDCSNGISGDMLLKAAADLSGRSDEIYEKINEAAEHGLSLIHICRQYNEQTFHLLMRSVFFEHFRRGTVKCGDRQCYEGRYDKEVRRQYVEQRQRYGVVGVYIYQTVAEADCKALEPVSYTHLIRCCMKDRSRNLREADRQRPDPR